MDINFPIIVQDRDGYLYKIQDTNTINKIEYNDLYYNEFVKSWDYHAFPIQIYLENIYDINSKILVKLSGNTSDKTNMSKAIINYIKKYKNKYAGCDLENYTLNNLIELIDNL